MRNIGIAVLASAMWFGCGVGEAAVDGQPEGTEAVDNAIVGGSVDYGHPAVGVILMDQTMWSGAMGTNKCTGTLIGPKLVLTAAHCVKPSGGMITSARVYFGTNAETAPASAFVSATLWAAHPSYNQVVGDPYDIAVLVLSQAQSITPMPYNRSAMASSLVGQPVTSVGYGATVGGQAWTKGIKRQVTTPLVSIDANGKHFKIGAAGTTTCQGDSGGPQTMRLGGVETVMGVTSYGPIPCQSGPGTAVRTDPYQSFINLYVNF